MSLHFSEIAKKMMFLCSLWLGGGCTSWSPTGGYEVANSEPINGREAKEYHKEIIRCLRTGGTRVVKIENHLKCY